MIKKTIALLLFFVMFSNITRAQISIGPRHIGKQKKFSDDEFKKFKKTKTVFILSDIIDKDTYFEILDSSWTVTPYELVHVTNFDKKKFPEDEYSYVELKGYVRSKTMKSGATVNYLHIFLDIMMYDAKNLKKELLKNKGAKKKKIDKIYRQNRMTIGRVELFPTDVFIHKAISGETDDIIKSIYFEDVFYTYEPGFLKNIFQKVNDQIKKEETYWMYGSDYTSELKKLKSKTLYIPSYHTIKYNAFKATDKDKKASDTKKLYDTYNYKYVIQDDDELNERILKGEEFYYLRYTRVNSQKFIHIVNSKTGEIIYRDYAAGFSYNIKAKHIKNINQKIKKALKR